MSLPRLTWAALLLLLLLAGRPIQAAEVTDVLDAFDGDDPFDFSLRLRFESETRDSTVSREVRCLQNDQSGTVCAGASGIVLAKELSYQRVRNVLHFDLRFGLFKDLEFRVNLPIVTGDSWNHKFVDGVGRDNSTLYPPNDNDALFKVPYQSQKRSGFGDMKLGLAWAPFNWYRDDTHPTWLVGIDYTLATGTPMKATNTDVGQGASELTFHTTISRRALKMLEPYFNLHFVGRFGSDSGLFISHGETQKYVAPGSTIGTQVGLAVLPWENAKRDERVEIEGGLGSDYTFRGREYTEIWEAMASPDNPCKEKCNQILHSNSVPDANGKQRRTDGITEVEQYARFHGWLGLHYQPVKYFEISAKVNWMQETPHFLTDAYVGKDLDGNKGVTATGQKGNEYNLTFLPSVDTPGSRLRVQDAGSFGFHVAISGKL